MLNRRPGSGSWGAIAGVLLAVRIAAGPAAAGDDAAARRRAWSARGWVEGDLSASDARRSNLPLGFNRKADHAHLHQAWLSLDLPVDRSRPRHPGLHLDLLVGQDHVFTRPRGLFPGQTSEIGLDPIQFSLGWTVSGLGRGTDLRLGRFATPIGAEYNAGPSNMVPSHSYAFIYDPFTHTGLHAETKLDDSWTLISGLTTGSDIFIDPAARATVLTGARYIDGNDARKSIQLVSILGPGRFLAEHDFTHVDVVDLVATYPLGNHLLFTGDLVYGWVDDVPDTGRADWLGFVPYLTWTISDELAATLRLERFDDDEGNRTGFAGTYRTATLGLHWKPETWLGVRPEIRFDHHDGATPFEGRAHLTTATLNVYVAWSP